MSSVVISGDTSGSITLSAPAVAGTNTITLPANAGTIVTTASSAVVTQAMLGTNVAGNGPAFSAIPSAASTNISSSTWTKVTLDTEVYDTNSNFASSRFTPTVAGYYQINFIANLGTSANNGLWFGTAIYKNGAAYAQAFPVFPAGNVQSYTNNLSPIINMNGSSDYLEFYVNVYVLAGTPNYGGGSTTGTLVSGCLVRSA